MTKTITAANVAGKLRSIRFTQLPAAADAYVARRLYRSENDGPFVLVAQFNRQDTVFVDNGTTRGGVLQLPPIGAVTADAAAGRHARRRARYNYRVTYVDALGKESRASDPTAKRDVRRQPDGAGCPARAPFCWNGCRRRMPLATTSAAASTAARSTGPGPYQLVAEIDATADVFPG